MICVWEQTHGPCMFLLTLLQILGQIKDATWLLQTKCSDRAYFVFLTSSIHQIFSCTFTSLCLFPTNYHPFHFLLSPFSSCPTSIFLSLPNISIAIPLPDVSHIPITLSPHVRKTRVCVVSALLWERSSSGSTGPVVGSACGAGRGPLLGSDHFSGSN